MNAHASVASCIGASDGFQACLLENMIVRGSLICTACGHRDNADRNAALNIKASGNGATGRGGSEKTLKDLSYKARPVKRQMDTKFLV